MFKDQSLGIVCDWVFEVQGYHCVHQKYANYSGYLSKGNEQLCSVSQPRKALLCSIGLYAKYSIAQNDWFFFFFKIPLQVNWSVESSMRAIQDATYLDILDIS